MNRGGRVGRHIPAEVKALEVRLREGLGRVTDEVAKRVDGIRVDIEGITQGSMQDAGSRRLEEVLQSSAHPNLSMAARLHGDDPVTALR